MLLLKSSEQTTVKLIYNCINNSYFEITILEMVERKGAEHKETRIKNKERGS